jgi:hypothetical protein
MPHVEAGRRTDAKAGAKLAPPRPAIRSIASANVKLPPQTLYNRRQRADNSMTMRRRGARFHATQPPHLQAPRSRLPAWDASFCNLSALAIERPHSFGAILHRAHMLARIAPKASARRVLPNVPRTRPDTQRRVSGAL